MKFPLLLFTMEEPSRPLGDAPFGVTSSLIKFIKKKCLDDPSQLLSSHLSSFLHQINTTINEVLLKKFSQKLISYNKCLVQISSSSKWIDNWGQQRRSDRSERLSFCWFRWGEMRNRHGLDENLPYVSNEKNIWPLFILKNDSFHPESDNAWDEIASSWSTRSFFLKFLSRFWNQYPISYTICKITFINLKNSSILIRGAKISSLFVEWSNNFASHGGQ